MIIDCHAHLVPKSWYHPKSPRSIFDVDELFRQQEQSGVNLQCSAITGFAHRMAMIH